jgi:hypothetical protein
MKYYTLLDAELSKYKNQPHDFHNKEFCYEISNIEDFAKLGELHSKEITVMPWGETPPQINLDKVNFLNVSPPLDNIDGKFLPNIIQEMKNIEFIRLPLTYALNLKEGFIPNSLKYFAIVNQKSYVELLSPNKKRYPNDLAFPNICFPNVKAFGMRNLSNAISVEDYLNISMQNFPKLEYLRCSLSANMLKEFSGLKHLCIGGVDKINIFDIIISKLQSLHIEGAGKSFNISEMVKIPSIEMVRFNSIYNVINCDDFLKMPHLKEIYILNTSTIINIEALLEMKSLKSLIIVSCKKAFNKDIKKRFKSKSEQFEILDIDYSG